MIFSISVENIRCGGCANSITHKLMTNEHINSVDVNVNEQTVTLTLDDALDEPTRDNVKATAQQQLHQLGYPERGSVEGLQALTGKAKAVVSCAIGKIS
ncbi:MAG TPA: cation transporter [Thiothrix sp.]|nr:cation transporter [Thiothrix sp.]